MPPCTAFTRNATPCTANGHTDGLCGRHAPMNRTPEMAITFNRDQARLRAIWVANAAVIPVVAAEPEAPPPVCGHPKQSGQLCEHRAQHPDGKCTVHHNMLVRRQEMAAVKVVITRARTRYRHGDTEAQIDQLVAEALPGISAGLRQHLQWKIDDMLISRFIGAVQALVNIGADRAELVGVVNGWAALEQLSARRCVLVLESAERLLRARAWREQAAVNPVQAFRADQREAQLAHDNQNVHTQEISKQMKDSIALLIAVEVPSTQTNTFLELSESWRRLSATQAELDAVYADAVSWWNRPTIFAQGDKLYRKCLRGLWWTIKNYKGDVREELEKRLWQECKEAAIPYSVCTQGHMARLSNVMVGFDDAFAPPVPVGEILQQRMAAISAMDLEYDQQIEMAEQVLAELKIPHEEHKNWLAAF
jgi:hypothetical protein